MLEVFPDPLVLSLHAVPVACRGLDQLQLRAHRSQGSHRLLDVGVGDLVGVEFGAVAGQVVEHFDRIGVLSQPCRWVCSGRVAVGRRERDLRPRTKVRNERGRAFRDSWFRSGTLTVAVCRLARSYRRQNWVILPRFFDSSVPMPPIPCRRMISKSSDDLRQTVRSERLLTPPTRMRTSTRGR
jgi:hypothetical protein